MILNVLALVHGLRGTVTSRLLSALLAFTTVLLGASTAHAQTATPTSKFAIDEAAPDLATANSYIYRYYPDGATTGIVIAMTCTGTVSPFVCVGNVPAFTPGAHSVTFTAGIGGANPVESVKSVPVNFTMVLVPSVPLNPRVQ